MRSSPTESSPRPVALITGASAGIGEALARAYVKRGYRVVAVARRAERLTALREELAKEGGELLGVVADVGVDGEMERAVDEAQRAFGRLDVVVANAGISIAGNVEALTLADHRRVFETNVFGALRTAYAAFPALKASRGSFAVVGSIMGFLSVPGFGTYAASKFAVRAYAEALWFEWAEHGISVTHVAPGYVESEIRKVGNDGVFREERADPVPAWIVVPAPVAATEIILGIAARKREIVVTGHGKAIAFIAQNAPSLVRATLKVAGRRLPRKQP